MLLIATYRSPELKHNPSMIAAAMVTIMIMAALPVARMDIALRVLGSKTESKCKTYNGYLAPLGSMTF
jgi:hypothetical protein